MDLFYFFMKIHILFESLVWVSNTHIKCRKVIIATKYLVH